MPYFTYIIYSDLIDQYYIGSTGNLEDRLKRHIQGRSKATKKGAPNWKLLFWEEFPSRDLAVQREIYFKKMKSRFFLEQLILKFTPPD